MCGSITCYNQLQKYLRHCIVFWHKWPVHDVVLVILPSPLIKVSSNTRPFSKLGGPILNGREKGGQYYGSLTYDQQRFEARKVVFFRGTVSSIMQLVVALARNRYWVIEGRQEVKNWDNECKLCKRRRAQPAVETWNKDESVCKMLC